MADGQAFADLPREALDDDAVDAADTAHRLQAAERKLQIAIQEALTRGQEVSHG